MAKADYQIVPYDKGKHDRSGFDCNVPSLNAWLATKVNQFDKKDLSRTYVIVKTGEVRIKGYFAISNHTVQFQALPADQAKGLPQIDLSVILLGKLAVDRRERGNGLGKSLMIGCFRYAEYLARKIGSGGIEVDALDDDMKRFYEQFGFITLRDEPRHLLLPMKVIRKLRLPPLNSGEM